MGLWNIFELTWLLLNTFCQNNIRWLIVEEFFARNCGDGFGYGYWWAKWVGGREKVVCGYMITFIFVTIFEVK